MSKIELITLGQLCVVSALAGALISCMGTTNRVGDGGTIISSTENEIKTDIRSNIDFSGQAERIRKYLDMSIEPPNDNHATFDSNSVVILLNGQILKPGFMETNDVQVSSESEEGLFSILNANQGPGSSLRSPSFNIAIDGLSLLPIGALQEDSYAPKKGLFLHTEMPIHPANTDVDDPNMLYLPFRYKKVQSGVYKGRLTIQSLDNSEIIRKFTLRIK